MSEAHAPAFEPIECRDSDRVLERATARAPWPHGWHDLGAVALTDRRDALRIYSRLGLHPIILHGLAADGGCTCPRGRDCPPRTRGKHPVLSAWQSLPLDLDAADRMLISNWRFNVGLKMGRQPGRLDLIALDVDGGRDEVLEPLERRLGKLPVTLTACTGSGGLHLIFRVRSSERIRNRVKLAPGLDVRSRGGQIVVAPSRHGSGSVYRWTDVREPAELLT